MSRTVFILGAGASADGGAPLMSNFLEVAERLLATGQMADNTDFKLVFKARAELQAVHSKAQLNIENLESVFAAFEMAALRGSLGSLEPHEVELLPRSLRLVIAQTLESTVRWMGHESTVDSPPPYDEFADMIGAAVHPPMGPMPVSIITFNYDVALDYALLKQLRPAGIEIDYCLTDTPRRPDRLDVLKLHGSLNWGRCDEGNCEGIAVQDVIKLADRHFIRTTHDTSPKSLRLPIASSVPNLRCPSSGRPCIGHPLIVPPTWSKTYHYQRIAHVWRRAAQHLSEAEHIVVIGFSLVPTDESFRYLYALGTVGDTWLKKFWVVDWNGLSAEQRRSLEERYRGLLGPSVIPSRLEISFETFRWGIRELPNRVRLRLE